MVRNEKLLSAKIAGKNLIAFKQKDVAFSSCGLIHAFFNVRLKPSKVAKSVMQSATVLSSTTNNMLKLMSASASKNQSSLVAFVSPRNSAIANMSRHDMDVMPVAHAPIPALALTCAKKPLPANNPHISQEKACGLVCPANMLLK